MPRSAAVQRTYQAGGMIIGMLLVGLTALLIASCGGDGKDSSSATAAPSPVENTPSDSGVCLPEETRLPLRVACEDLAEKFDVARSDIELISAEPRDWPDSCLNIRQTDEVCAQVITPGYEVVLAISEQPRRFTYNTDEGTNVRLANIDLGASAVPTGLFGEAETIVRAYEPVAFDFAPDGRIFFTERQQGEIHTIMPGGDETSGAVWARVPTFRGSECGLLGIVLDRDFAANHFVYVYVTQPVSGRSDVGKPRIVRYTDVDGKGSEPVVLTEDLPLTNAGICAHVSGNLHFGPDGYLYVSVGNFERRETAADLAVLTGKFLRINKTDGSAAPDNPFAARAGADARIFAYGFRNPWDFAFHPQTGKIYAPDNGPGNCDELNIVEAGADYGVPRSLPRAETDSCLGLGGVDPIFLFALAGKTPEDFPSNVAPAGVAFLEGDRYPQLGEGLLVCEFMPQELHFLRLSGPNQDEVVEDIVVTSGCGFNVEVHDGLIYFSGSSGIFRIPAPAS